jgi:hypothetical protein
VWQRTLEVLCRDVEWQNRLDQCVLNLNSITVIPGVTLSYHALLGRQCMFLIPEGF